MTRHSILSPFFHPLNFTAYACGLEKPTLRPEWAHLGEHKMGNHDIGRGMSAAARAFWVAMGDNAPTKEKALAALDAAGEDYIGGDAEFDDELSTWSPLSRLVAVAFDATPEEVADLKGEREEGRIEDAGELWYDGPYRRFSEHFHFC